MSIYKLMFLTGLCVLFTGCATEGFHERGPVKTEGSSTTRTGVRYLLGRGVPQDNAKAFSYFLEAAKADDPFAQNEVAYLYAAGKGTRRDDAQAFYWYEKAAKHGLASAQYNLGLLYLHGIGTPMNKALGKEWIAKAAAKGFEPARLQLTRS